MSIQDVSPEQLAELLHHYQQALAPDFGGSAKASGSEPWREVSTEERNRLVAAARLALMAIQERAEQSSRRYFAKPGEAKWGC